MLLTAKTPEKGKVSTSAFIRRLRRHPETFGFDNRLGFFSVDFRGNLGFCVVFNFRIDDGLTAEAGCFFDFLGVEAELASSGDLG